MKQKYNVGDHVIIEESNIESIYPCAGKTGVIMYSDGSYKHPHWVKVDGGSEVYCAVKCLVGEKKIVITTDGKVTTAKLYEDGKTVKTATAKCAPEDTFDFNVGAKLAMERLMSKSEPVTEWKVVNRKPRVGDYIRLKTNGHYYFSAPGDILKVDELGYNVVRVYGRNHPRNTDDANFAWAYSPHEYEVVEKVTDTTPEKPKEEPPKYYNGKVVCVKTKYPWWTVGKVYDVVDGFIKDDYGDEYPSTKHNPPFKPYRDAEDVRHAGCRDEDDNGRHNIFNEFIPLVEDKGPDRPLTNDELMQMDGQKVWLSSLYNGSERFIDKDCGWFKINVKTDKLTRDDHEHYYFHSNGSPYGFRAYLRPQKQK